MFTQANFFLDSKNTVHYDPVTNTVSWFKGDNEIVIYDVTKDSEIEDLSYFAKDGTIISDIALNNKGANLVTLTFSRGKEHAYLNNFNVNSEKLVHSLEFPIINPSGAFPPLRELPTGFTLVENVKFF